MKLSEGNRLRVLYFLVFCCTASWLPIFADYLKGRGLSGMQIGMTLSITPFMMFLVQPFYGMLADRWGYRRCMLVSTIFASLGYAAYLYEGGFVYLFVVTVFMSLFYNTLQPVLDSLSLSLTERDPHFSYGSLRIAGAAGWAVTGIIVGYYIDMIDARVIFPFSAASLLLAFVFSFGLRKDKLAKANLQMLSFRNLRNAAGSWVFLILLTAVFLISVAGTTIWNFYSIYMKENGASASLVGIGISFQGLCELPFFYFSARIIARLGMKSTLILTFGALALRLFLYGVVDTPEAAIFIEVLHGVSWSLFWVASVETVNQLVEEEWRATGQSLLYAAYFGLGAIVGNLWTGYLFDSQLKVGQIFLLNAALVSAVTVAVAIFLKGHKLVGRGPRKPEPRLS